ncbi:hypothetical protein AGMMS49928_20870 [Spirochaetia bacterium]|nr:hypothetical protein AGMMS49928_20870 [Spirochaetia bacterium]
MEDGYIPIADVGFYHAVPGNTDRLKVIRAVGGYEGTRYLEKALFWVVLYFRTVASGGFLV